LNANGSVVTLFGKTRGSILALLYGHSDEAFYVRQIIRVLSAGQGAVQRELKTLSEAGIICRRMEGHQVYYQANRDSPIFGDLQALVTKTFGVADVLRAALAGLSDRVLVAFVYGSVAKGAAKADSDVDLLIVGSATFAEVVSALRPAQERLSREVNPSVYPPAEFRRKLAEGSRFLATVVRERKIFVLGDDHELAALAA